MPTTPSDFCIMSFLNLRVVFVVGCRSVCLIDFLGAQRLGDNPNDSVNIRFNNDDTDTFLDRAIDLISFCCFVVALNVIVLRSNSSDSVVFFLIV